VLASRIIAREFQHDHLLATLAPIGGDDLEPARLEEPERRLVVREH